MKNELIKKIFLRIITSIVLLFLVISFVFIVINISPGNPAQKYISPNISAALHKEVSKSFKLNEPILSRYFAFAKNTFVAEFGTSLNYRKPVSSVIMEYLSFTLVFSFLSFTIQIIIAFLLVYFVFLNGSRTIERVIGNSTLALYSIPVFLLGVLLIYLFSFVIPLFPSSGLKSINFESLSFIEKIADYFSHLILPIISSSFIGIPIYYKYLLASVKSNAKNTFILNLKAIGMSEQKILFKHIIPNSLNSVIAIAGVEIGFLLGGSILIETIFGLPGMGRLTMNAVSTRDYPLIIGCILTAGVMIILVNLITDIVRVIIDKRLLKGLLS